jgi:hypothetical protein
MILKYKKHKDLDIFQQKVVLLSYSVEQSPWEANWFSASQEVPHIL